MSETPMQGESQELPPPTSGSDVQQSSSVQGGSGQGEIVQGQVEVRGDGEHERGCKVQERGGDLVLTLSGRPGRAERAVDWLLALPKHDAFVVIVVRAEGTASASLTVSGPGGSASVKIPVATEPRRYEILTLRLKPGRDYKIAIEAEPAGRRARVALNEVRTYEVPRKR